MRSELARAYIDLVSVRIVILSTELLIFIKFKKYK